MWLHTSKEREDAPDQGKLELKSADFQGLEQQMGGGGGGRGAKRTGGAAGVKLCPDLCSDSPAHLQSLASVYSLNLQSSRPQHPVVIA